MQLLKSVNGTANKDVNYKWQNLYRNIITSVMWTWKLNWWIHHSQWMHAHKSYVISLSSCIVNWSVRSTSFITIFYSCIIEVFSAEEGIQMVYLKTSILRVKYKKHASNTASLNVNLYIMLNRFWENLVKNLFLIKKRTNPI